MMAMAGSVERRLRKLLGGIGKPYRGKLDLTNKGGKERIRVLEEELEASRAKQLAEDIPDKNYELGPARDDFKGSGEFQKGSGGGRRVVRDTKTLG